MTLSDQFIMSIPVTGEENKHLAPSDTLVIQVMFGGLGDHLFYSHIPRIAKETGKYKQVYISDHSEYRNTVYKHFIWELNPYVDGFTDKPGWYPEIANIVSNCNLLDMIMLGYGLDDSQRMHEPEFYYQPAILPELTDKIIFDPNFITNAGSGIGIKKIKSFFKSNSKPIDLILKPGEKSLVPIKLPFIETSSFEEYCSIIVSAKKFYCLTSGGATLAAALKKPATVLYGKGVKPKFHHSKLHTYIFLEPDKKTIINRIKTRIRLAFGKK